MSYSEVLVTVESLPKADKVKLLKKLAGELSNVNIGKRKTRKNYPIWSPSVSDDVVERMMEALERDKAENP